MPTEIKPNQHLSEKTEFKKGMIPWNKGLKGAQKGKQGKESHFWKGGHYKDKKGYIVTYMPNHPFANKGGQVMEHRLIMEMYLGRYITKIEVVHHKNYIREDNRIENLMLFKNRKEHEQYHKEHPEESLLTLPT